VILDNPKPFRHASPSQIKTYRRCARRWWYNKIAGLQDPPGPAAILGSKVHNVAERWLLGELEIGANGQVTCQGKMPSVEAVRIFAPGRKFLPQPPVPFGLVERWIGSAGVCHPFSANPDGRALPTPVVPLVGRVDLLDGGCVVDHKTTSDEQWALGEEQLLEDAQAAVYTREHLLAGAEEVGFRHVYYATRGRPRSWAVTVTIDRARSNRLWAGVLKTLAAMKTASVFCDDREVDHNPTACGDYGGCSYRDRCPARPRGVFMGLFGGDNNSSQTTGLSLAERLAALKEGSPADDAAERIREAAKAHSIDGSAAVQPAQPAPAHPNPPDGTPPNVVGDVGKKARRGLELPSGVKVSTALVEDLANFLGVDKKIAPDDLAAQFGVSRDGETRGKLLRRIAEGVLLGEIEPAAAVEEPVEEPAKAAEEPAEQPATVEQPAKAGVALLVGCIPEIVSGRVVHLRELLADHEEAHCSEHGVAYPYAAAYREGQCSIAERLARQLADDGDMLEGCQLVIPTDHPAAEEVLAVLYPIAATVIRGLS